MNRVLVSVAVAIVVLVGSIAAYELTPTQSNTLLPCPASYDVGHYSLWAGGSSADCPFIIARSGTLTGGFKANASLVFAIQTADEFQQRTVGTIPTIYFWGLRNTTGTNLDVS